MSYEAKRVYRYWVPHPDDWRWLFDRNRLLRLRLLLLVLLQRNSRRRYRRRATFRLRRRWRLLPLYTSGSFQLNDVQPFRMMSLLVLDDVPINVFQFLWHCLRMRSIMTLQRFPWSFFVRARRFHVRKVNGRSASKPTVASSLLYLTERFWKRNYDTFLRLQKSISKIFFRSNLQIFQTQFCHNV